MSNIQEFDLDQLISEAQTLINDVVSMAGELKKSEGQAMAKKEESSKEESSKEESSEESSMKKEESAKEESSKEESSKESSLKKDDDSGFESPSPEAQPEDNQMEQQEEHLEDMLKDLPQEMLQELIQKAQMELSSRQQQEEPQQPQEASQQAPEMAMKSEKVENTELEEMKARLKKAEDENADLKQVVHTTLEIVQKVSNTPVKKAVTGMDVAFVDKGEAQLNKSESMSQEDALKKAKELARDNKKLSTLSKSERESLSDFLIAKKVNEKVLQILNK